jgi:hypothetical protein
MSAPASFVETAKVAMEISLRIRRDLGDIRNALVKHDRATAVVLMYEFFNVHPDFAIESEQNHDQKKPTENVRSAEAQRLVS